MAVLVFHGTVYNFDVPLLSRCKDYKDFGKGFYLADDLEHARSVARKGYLLNPYNSEKYVYSYRIDLSEMDKLGLKIHIFRGADYSWLEFVMRNRNMLDVENYDVIIGPTADKDAQKDIESFYRKYGWNASEQAKDMLLMKLKTDIYGKQYCFRTEDAINYLNKHFCERRSFV